MFELDVRFDILFVFFIGLDVRFLFCLTSGLVFTSGLTAGSVFAISTSLDLTLRLIFKLVPILKPVLDTSILLL